MGDGIRADRGQSYASLEQTASRVRAIIAPGLTPSDPLPGVQIFQGLERFFVVVRGQKVPLTYGVEQLPPGVEALTRYQPDEKNVIVILSEETYGALEREDPRARFATFHEIGHAVLHVPELMRLSQIPHGKLGLHRKTDYAGYFDTEWQANAFSAALMMPAEGLAMLERNVGPGWITQVPGRFKASWEATRIRADVFAKRRAELLVK